MANIKIRCPHYVFLVIVVCTLLLPVLSRPAFAEADAAKYVPPASINGISNTDLTISLKDANLSGPGKCYSLHPGQDFYGNKLSVDCSTLVKDALQTLSINPQAIVIFDDRTFQALYSAGKDLQKDLQNNWWNGSITNINDGLLKYYIVLNNELVSYKKDPQSHPLSRFTDNKGSITFSNTKDDTSGVKKWAAYRESRTSINRDISELYYLLKVMHSARAPGLGHGTMWRTDENFFGVTADGTEQNVDEDSVYHPSNIQSVITNGDGFDKLTIDSGHTYKSLDTFTVDYKLFYDLQATNIASNVDFNGNPISGGSSVTLDQAIAAFGGIANSVQLTTDNTIKSVNKNRCGQSPYFSIGFNIDILYYSGCVITDFIANFADGALLSAGQLLAYTAGVPQATVPQAILPENHFEDGGAPSSFWGDVLPPDVKTPFQTLMVNRDTDVGQTVYTTQAVLTKFLDVLIVLIFLVVAIMNILQIQVATFSIRKLIPGLIIGFIVAQASFFIIRGALEVVGYASNGIISLAAPPLADSAVNPLRANIFKNYVDNFARVRGPNGNACLTTAPTGSDCSSAGSKIENGKVFQQFILNFFVLAGAAILFILGFLFGVRVFIFTIAVPLAPIAVLCRFFPPLGFIWTRWFKTVSSWIIMPLPAMGMLLMSSIFFSVGNKLPTNNLFGYLLNYVAGIIFLYGAIKIPFSFAGEAKGFMDRYNALGKMAYNKSVGAGLKAGGTYIKEGTQAQIGLSKIGDAQRFMARKKSERDDYIKEAKEGRIANVGGRRREKDLETKLAQKKAGSKQNQDQVSARITQLESKNQQLNNDLTDPTKTVVQRAEISKQILDNNNEIKIQRDQQKYKDPTFLKSLDKEIAALDKQKSKDWREKRNTRTYQADILHQKEHELTKGSLDASKASAELGLATGSHEYKEAIELTELTKQEASRMNEDVKLKNRSYVANAESAPPELRPVLKQQRLRDQFDSAIKAEKFEDDGKQDRRDYSYAVLYNSGGIKPTDDTGRKEYEKAVRDVSGAVGERVGKPELVISMDKVEVTDLISGVAPRSISELEGKRKAIASLFTLMNSMNANLDRARLQEIGEELKKASPGDADALDALGMGDERREKKAEDVKEVLLNTVIGARYQQLRKDFTKEFHGPIPPNP